MQVNGGNGRITARGWLWEYISKMALAAWMRMIPSPPLLPVVDPSPPHPIIETLQNLDLGKLVLTLAATTTLGLLFSDHFDAAAGPHQFIVCALMSAFMILWTGTLLRNISPGFGTILELLGISLVLFFFFGLVATFLSGPFSLACWLSGALCLMPFVVYVLLKPR